MLKYLIIAFIIIVVIKIGMNASNMLYLWRTLFLLNDNIKTTKRIIHTRRLCMEVGINGGRYFDEPTFNKKEIQQLVTMAYGEYAHRLKEAFNPFYWIKVVIFLPQNIVMYFGGNPRSVASKILNFIYWLIGTAITISVSIYPDEIRAFLDKIFNL